MNYNITGYIIYLSVTFFIIVYVGLVFYRNGRVFILGLFAGNGELTDRTNKLLLAGYYLVNLGYALLSIHQWERITCWMHLIACISERIGMLTVMLAILHYINMAVIWFASRSSKKLFHHH